MNIKHKLLSDYQHTTLDKKIFLIKSGTILENYIYKIKGEKIEIDKEIVDANPQYFQPVDWKHELTSYLKVNKIPSPAILSKKLVPFIEEMFIITQSIEKVSNIDDSEIRSKLKELNARETELEKEYRYKLREVEEKLTKTEVESKYVYKVKEIEKMIVDYYNNIPWYHNEMWEFKSKLEGIIDEFKKL